MGAVSCQRDICSGVAQHETLQAANQKATETTDGEPEKNGKHIKIVLVSTYALQGLEACLPASAQSRPALLSSARGKNIGTETTA